MYIEKCLAASLAHDDILVLDNCSVHKSKLVIETLEKHKINFTFLPPYSPDFNPIELLWSKMKSSLRSLKARNKPDLNTAICKALDGVSHSNAINWFRHCGYATDNS